MSSRQCPAEGFNPRPAGWGGATTVCRKRINLLPVSIHAPPVGAGRLRGLPLRLARTRRFNPRPAGWGGATRYCTNGGAVTCVSIHAPPVGAGRRSGAFRMRRDSAFQSTPRRLGRGDSFQPYGSESPIGFNPRPAGWGGATAGDCNASRVWAFQSTPRRLGRGDSQSKAKLGDDTMFQSTPRRLGRGDFFTFFSVDGKQSFNPRPAGWGGATR